MASSKEPGLGQTSILAEGVPVLMVASQALTAEAGVAFVDRAERAEYLVSLLHIYDQLPDTETWLKAAKNPRTSLHNKIFTENSARANDYITGAERKREVMLETAKSLFRKAYGLEAVLDADLLPEPDAKLMADKDFKSFESSFRGSTTTRYNKRAELRLKLQISRHAPTQDQVGEAVPTKLINLKARTALARMLRPDFQGLQREKYNHITFKDLQRYNPSYLRSQLLNTPRGTPNTVSYANETEGRLVTVVLTPDAWKLSRSVEMLGQAAANGSETKRNKNAALSTDTDAPRRAGVHAVESRLAQIQKYKANVIDDSLELISQFEEALGNNAGLARFGLEATARQKLAWLQSGTLNDMLLAVGMNANLNTAERTTMARSLEKAIYFASSSSLKRRNFGQVLSVAKDWRTAQAQLFNSLIHECTNYLEKNGDDNSV